MVNLDRNKKFKMESTPIKKKFQWHDIFLAGRNFADYIIQISLYYIIKVLAMVGH